MPRLTKKRILVFTIIGLVIALQAYLDIKYRGMAISMRLFYQTKTQNAQSILRDGFRDSVLEVTDEGLPLI